MKKRIDKKFYLIGLDILVIPAMFLCEKLSDLMLSQYSQCGFLLLGGKCITCGGTHFVNTLLNFKFIEAFHHNEFLFALTAFLAVAFILWNLDWLFGIQWAKKINKYLISVPSLIIWCVIMLGFFFIRNINLFANIIRYVLYLLSTKL